MEIKWIRLVLLLGLILALTACVQPKEASPKADAPAQQAEQEDDQGDQAANDHDDDAAMDDDQAEGEDADTEDTDSGDSSEESDPAPPPIDAAAVYKTNCAGCHGDQRQGGGGPSLLPERLTKESTEYAKIISEGVTGTRMPTWKDKLSAEVITTLSEWILTPVE